MYKEHCKVQNLKLYNQHHCQQNLFVPLHFIDNKHSAVVCLGLFDDELSNALYIFYQNLTLFFP